MERPGNQSAEHWELVKRCIAWFDSRSTRRDVYAATEVAVADGYVVDAASLGGLQHRYLQSYLFDAGLKEKYARSTPDGAGFEVLGDVWNELTCVFEAKVTRSDFLSTFGASDKHANRKRPIASLHYCVTSTGLVEPSELPEFWGLLEVCGRGLRVARVAKFQQVSESSVWNFGYCLLRAGKRRTDHRRHAW